MQSENLHEASRDCRGVHISTIQSKNLQEVSRDVSTMATTSAHMATIQSENLQASTDCGAHIMVCVGEISSAFKLKVVSSGDAISHFGLLSRARLQSQIDCKIILGTCCKIKL